MVFGTVNIILTGWRVFVLMDTKMILVFTMLMVNKRVSMRTEMAYGEDKIMYKVLHRIMVGMVILKPIILTAKQQLLILLELVSGTTLCISTGLKIQLIQVG